MSHRFTQNVKTLSAFFKNLQTKTTKNKLQTDINT